MKISNKMIEQKLSIPFCNLFEKFQEENEEEYEIIKEDYHSSPKCGTKSHVVKNVYKNVVNRTNNNHLNSSQKFFF